MKTADATGRELYQHPNAGVTHLLNNGKWEQTNADGTTLRQGDPGVKFNFSTGLYVKDPSVAATTSPGDTRSLGSNSAGDSVNPNSRASNLPNASGTTKKNPAADSTSDPSTNRREPKKGTADVEAGSNDPYKAVSTEKYNELIKIPEDELAAKVKGGAETFPNRNDLAAAEKIVAERTAVTGDSESTGNVKLDMRDMDVPPSPFDAPSEPAAKRPAHDTENNPDLGGYIPENDPRHNDKAPIDNSDAPDGPTTGASE